MAEIQHAEYLMRPEANPARTLLSIAHGALNVRASSRDHRECDRLGPRFRRWYGVGGA